MSTSESRPKLGALTGIRFPFAVLVVINHVVGLYTQVGLRGDPNQPEFAQWCANNAAIVNSSWVFRGLVQGAAVGLSLFFILSGFILTYNYHGDVPPRPLDRREFWVARVARVYPLYLLGLFLTIPLLLVFIASHFAEWGLAKSIVLSMTAPFLLQAWWPESSALWNPPGWSLSVEAAFYVLFPWIVGIFDRLTIRQIWSIVPVLWIVSLVPPTIYHLLDPDGIGTVTYLTDDFWAIFVKHNPLFRLPEFLAGIALGRMYALRTSNPADTSWRGTGGWMSMSAMAVIVAVMIFAEPIPYLVLHNSLIMPLFFVLIYGLALEGGPLEWILSRRWHVLLGDATYSMYLLHTAIIMIMVIGLVKDKSFHHGPWKFMIWCIVITILVSLCTYSFFEIPTRRWIRRAFLRKRPRTGQTTHFPT